MNWLSEPRVFEIVLRVTAVFVVALLLDRVFSRELRFRRWLWALAFSSPLLALLPWPEFRLAVLPPEKERSYSYQVYELLPHFSSLKFEYQDNPPLSWVLLAAIGATFLGALTWLLRWVATVRIVRSAEQMVDEGLVDTLYELGQRHGLSDVPVLKASDRVQSLCIWGVTQPTILAPVGFFDKLPPEHWKLALEHEVRHLAGHDPFRLGFFSLIQHLLFWNPFVWLGLRRALLSQEQSVDAAVVDGGNRTAYVELLSRHLQPVVGGARLRLFGEGHLLTRMRRLSHLESARPRSGAWASLVLFPLLLAPVRLQHVYDPDPTQIGVDEVVFMSSRGGSRGLWRVTVDGRGEHRLPELFRDANVPSLSPDGRWLAYCRNGPNKEDIYVARVDGTDERLIVASPDRDYEPRWSPNGSRLVFCTMATGNWEIGLADIETASWTFVTKDGKRNLEPDWHPNGDRIVFSSHRTGVQKLWTMNLDGSELRQITHGSWEDTCGRFARNGRFLAFSSFRRTRYEASLIDLATGVVRPIAPFSQVDTGEVSFIDQDRSIAMSSTDGYERHVGKVDLRTFEFRWITSGADNRWPVARN